MDPITIATGVIAVLMPYLTEGTKWLLKKAEKSAGKIASKKIKILLKTLKNEWKRDITARDALKSFKGNPQGNKEIMMKILEEKLAQDMDLAAELSRQLKDMRPQIRVLQKAGIVNGEILAEFEDVVDTDIEAVQKARKVGENASMKAVFHRVGRDNDVKKTKKNQDIVTKPRHKIIDYNELIDRSTEEFVGREWVRKEVDDFLKHDRHRNFLILGEPGCGKTAFMADLVRRHRDYPYHFIGKGSQVYLTDSLDWCDPVRFAESVGYQLLRDYGGWIMSWDDWGIEVEQSVKDLQGLMVGAEVGEFMATPWLPSKPKLGVKQEAKRFGQAANIVGVYIEKFVTDVEQIVRQLLMTPLYNIAEKWPDHQFVVIVDGLDEAKTYSGTDRTIFKMLPNGSLPSNVRFLLSSRPGKHLEDDFRKQSRILWLSKYERSGRDERSERDERIIEDAKNYVTALAREKTVEVMLRNNKISHTDFIEKVGKASQGNFLYLHYYALGLKGGDKTLLNLGELPKGLNDIYKNFLGKIKGDIDNIKWIEVYKPILGTLAVAREPLTLLQIVDFSGVDEEYVGTILLSMRQFLDIQFKQKIEQYTLYHKSFGEYLVSNENRDRIVAKKAHKRIVEYYKLKKKSWKDAYARKYLVSHMIAAESWEDLEKLLTNIEYLTEKQGPDEQYLFQNDFINLLQNEGIETEKLVSILEKILNVIIEKLETRNEKADWLDIFSYWINEFGKIGSKEKKAALKKVANKFDYACGNVSKELSIKYEEEGESDWALRFAELRTWVYQRAEDYKKCAEACRFAEKMCLKDGMGEAYKLLGRAEFIRMRARALTKLSEMETDKHVKKTYAAQAHKAYQELNGVFKYDQKYSWEPNVQEWQKLEEDTGELLTPPPSTDEKPPKAQIISNAHDSISAMYVAQFFKKHGMNAKWIHTKKFRPKDLAPQDIKLTILIGGPKSPGISNVALKFYKADKDGFLELYSASGMIAKILKMKEGKTLCCMVGGPSKINTLMAAYNLSKDLEVIDFMKG